MDKIAKSRYKMYIRKTLFSSLEVFFLNSSLLKEIHFKYKNKDKFK